MTVYFIKPVGMDGPVKVGCSVSPEGRRKTLDTWSPFALEIIAEVPGGFDLEQRFHALFVETHQRREWFGWSRTIATTIAAIKDGSFDASTLPDPIKVSARRPEGYVHPMKGKKWSPERLAQYHHHLPLWKAERRSGLVLPGIPTQAQREAFIANPCRETGGVTREECRAYWRDHHARLAAERAALADRPTEQSREGMAA